MFARRHPFLFFLLVFTAMILAGVTVISGLFSLTSEKTRFDLGEKVGVVEINGVVSGAKDTLEQIKTFRETPSVKALVVRINSPGGAVGPSQEIYREIKKTMKEKHVVASLGLVAASGGYYIASAAEKIFSNPGTITGSIGVIMSYTNLQELFQKIGLSPVTIKSAEYKDIGSPVRKLSKEEEEILQKFVEDIHQQFVSDVAEGRGLEIEKVAEIADGRIYTGRKAKQIGLIDGFGNLEDAIEMAGRLGGIKGKVKAVYPPEKKKFSIIEYLLGTSLETFFQDLMKRQGMAPGISGGYLFRPGAD